MPERTCATTLIRNVPHPQTWEEPCGMFETQLRDILCRHPSLLRRELRDFQFPHRRGLNRRRSPLGGAVALIRDIMMRSYLATHVAEYATRGKLYDNRTRWI
jgi:hypothetical protein